MEGNEFSRNCTSNPLAMWVRTPVLTELPQIESLRTESEFYPTLSPSLDANYHRRRVSETGDRCVPLRTRPGKPTVSSHGPSLGRPCRGSWRCNFDPIPRIRTALTRVRPSQSGATGVGCVVRPLGIRIRPPREQSLISDADYRAEPLQRWTACGAEVRAFTVNLHFGEVLVGRRFFRLTQREQQVRPRYRVRPSEGAVRWARRRQLTRFDSLPDQAGKLFQIIGDGRSVASRFDERRHVDAVLTKSCWVKWSGASPPGELFSGRRLGHGVHRLGHGQPFDGEDAYARIIHDAAERAATSRTNVSTSSHEFARDEGPLAPPGIAQGARFHNKKALRRSRRRARFREN